MTYRNLLLEKKGHVRCVRMRRGEQGNTLDGATVAELAAACEEIGDDENAYVVVLAGEGEAFCRGWDASELKETAEAPDAARRERILGDSFSFLSRLSRPVIAAVKGEALSAGLELALACDVRVAGESARFGLPETSLGLLPSGGGTQRLPRVVGRAKALQMILLGEVIDAREALRCGLVSRIVADGRVDAEAQALAEKIAERGPLAVRYAKEAVLRGMEMPLEQALRFETDLTVILQTTEDRAEGVRAFLEKRGPHFKGR
ncbi:MAG TPA: enoyl-CoA hydratase-related protein [Dehalococcoidia bacterium]|nr:enoyl-CoA hydratase-related protein [Dehalococcoidia bacterium]